MFASGTVLEIQPGKSDGQTVRYSGVLIQDARRRCKKFSFSSTTYRLSDISADGLPCFSEGETFPTRLPRLGERLVFSYDPMKLDSRDPYLVVDALCWDYELAYMVQVEKLPRLRLVRWTRARVGSTVQNVILAILWKGKNPFNKRVGKIIERYSKFRLDSEYPPPRLAFISFSCQTHGWMEQPWPTGLPKL